MIYDIKAIPTTYAVVNFRSRLEARWAAFFDLADIGWEYEPFDLEGWAPDFLLRLELCNALCEVKPFDLTSFMQGEIEKPSGKTDISQFSKATRHSRYHQVLCLGSSPIFTRIPMPIGVPAIPPRGSTYTYDDIIDDLHIHNQEHIWREAGNIVQWIPSTADVPSARQIVDRAVRKAA